MAVGGPHEPRAVGAEHGEAVELWVRRHLLEPCAVDVYEIQIEVATARILVVRREDDAPPVGGDEGREVGTTQVRNLSLIGSVGVHHPDLHPIRADETLPQKCLVVRERRVRRMPGAVDDLFAVG